MNDRLNEIKFYQLAMELWNDHWKDCEVMIKDVKGREIVKQLTRSVGSIAANIEEGYGRGFGKEYPMFLRYSRGSARESKGWYIRSRALLPDEVVNQRMEKLDSIIAMETASIKTLKEKNKK
jgi:four helix bundle protein